MEQTRDNAGSSEKGPPAAWWHPDFVEKLESLSLGSQEDSSSRNSEQDDYSPQSASQILWSTGVLSETIPDGFYSVVLVCHSYHEYFLSIVLFL